MSHYIYRLFINFLLIHYFIYRLVRWSDPPYTPTHRLGYYPSPSYELYQNDPELYDVDYIYGDILNKSVLPVIIRADYNRDPEESELHHPYSHITLGGYKNCRIPVDRPISPMKFVKFIMEHFYYVPSSQLEFNFEIEGIVAFEEHIAEKDINKSRIIV